MQLIDLIALFIISITTLAGAHWGALRQVIALAATLLAIIIAGRYTLLVDDALSSFVTDISTSALLGYLLPLLGIAAAGGLLASAIHRFAGLRLATRIDLPLGGLLGAAEGSVFVIGLLYGLARFPLPAYPTLGSSAVGRMLRLAGYPLAQLLPETFRFAAQQVFG